MRALLTSRATRILAVALTAIGLAAVAPAAHAAAPTITRDAAGVARSTPYSWTVSAVSGSARGLAFAVCSVET